MLDFLKFLKEKSGFYTPTEAGVIDFEALGTA